MAKLYQHFIIKNISGQALVETLLVIVIISSAVFAALQLCIIAVDDMIYNEASFSAMRCGVVSSSSNVLETAADAAIMLTNPHSFSRKSTIYDETTVWNKKILGKNIVDHSGSEIKKYNTNIKYRTKIMFSSLLKPLHDASFLGGGSSVISNTARARMVKSPDEAFYFKAYPDADNFTGSSQ